MVYPALAAVRRSPVFIDHLGRWQAPAKMALLPKREASILGDLVSAPSADLLKRHRRQALRAANRRSADGGGCGQPSDM